VRNGRQPSKTVFRWAFEGIGRVIKRDVEQDADKDICHSIQPQLQPGVIDHIGTFDEAAPKNTVVTPIQFLPVTNHVAAIVRFVGHHHDNSKAGVAARELTARRSQGRRSRSASKPRFLEPRRRQAEESLLGQVNVAVPVVSRIPPRRRDTQVQS